MTKIEKGALTSKLTITSLPARGKCIISFKIQAIICHNKTRFGIINNKTMDIIKTCKITRISRLVDLHHQEFKIKIEEIMTCQITDSIILNT